jgi:hypothetical protein
MLMIGDVVRKEGRHDMAEHKSSGRACQDRRCEAIWVIGWPGRASGQHPSGQGETECSLPDNRIENPLPRLFDCHPKQAVPVVCGRTSLGRVKRAGQN